MCYLAESIILTHVARSGVVACQQPMHSESELASYITAIEVPTISKPGVFNFCSGYGFLPACQAKESFIHFFIPSHLTTKIAGWLAD